MVLLALVQKAIGAFDGQNDLGVGNDSDGWVREDGGEGGSGVTVPGQVENGGGGGGGGFGDFVGDLVGDLLPDPNFTKMSKLGNV